MVALEAHDLLQPAPHAWLLAAHDLLVAWNLASLGRLEEAEPAARSSVKRFDAEGEVFLVVSPLNALAGIAEARGDLDGASAAYEALLERCRVRASAFTCRSALSLSPRCGPGKATTALRLAVNADPAFGLAIADLDAITRTAGEGPSRQQMNWERHHIEVVRTAATGNTERAAGLLCEHLATVGCDPLAVRIAAHLRRPGGHDDHFEDLIGRLPGCHATLWPCSQ